jgi:hypothetical protein
MDTTKLATHIAAVPLYEDCSSLTRSPPAIVGIAAMSQCSMHCRRVQELESEHRTLQQELEAQQFEALQAKYGFSDKVSRTGSEL